MVSIYMYRLKENISAAHGISEVYERNSDVTEGHFLQIDKA